MVACFTVGLSVFALSLGLKVTVNDRRGCTRRFFHRKTLVSSLRRTGPTIYRQPNGSATFNCFPSRAHLVRIIRSDCRAWKAESWKPGNSKSPFCVGHLSQRGASGTALSLMGSRIQTTLKRHPCRHVFTSSILQQM